MSYNIFNNDCLKILPTLDNNSVDLILMDPPYGMKYKSCWTEELRKTDKVIEGDDEDYYNLLDSTLNECRRILKENKAIYI